MFKQTTVVPEIWEVILWFLIKIATIDINEGGIFYLTEKELPERSYPF